MSNVTVTGGICSSRELSAGLKARAGSSAEDTNGSATAQIPVSESSKNRKRPTQHEAARRIEGSLVHMLRHLNEPLRVSTLSALSGLSVSLYSFLFKCATGYAPIEFFIRMRMQRACELLRETTLSIKEVAAMLGYGDPFYFSRVFKSVNGVAPSYYRLRLTESKQAEDDVPPFHAQNKTPEAFPTRHLAVSKQFKKGALNAEASNERNGYSASVSRAISSRELKSPKRPNHFSKCP